MTAPTRDAVLQILHDYAEAVRGPWSVNTRDWAEQLEDLLVPAGALDREKAREALIDYDRTMGDADMLPPDALEAALHAAEDGALDALEACVLPDPRVVAARALHVLDPDLSAGPRCRVCVYEPWPCATARILDGETS
jgi:hypothetical protein